MSCGVIAAVFDSNLNTTGFPSFVTVVIEFAFQDEINEELC